MTSASAPAAPPRRLPPSVLLLVGATLAFALGRTTAALVAVAAAVVGQQLAWLFPAPARRLALAVDAAIHRVSAFIGTAAFTVVHVVVVVPAWVVSGSRLRRHGTTGWVAAPGASGDPHRMHAAEPTARGNRLDLVGGLAIVVVAFLLVGAMGGTEPDAATADGQLADRATATAELPPALVDQADAPDLLQQQGQVFAEREADPVLGWTLPDSTAPLVNQRDGVRVTPAPDGVGDDPLVVWFFGGSVAWGLGQRDGATIPARFAARATERGRPVVARNFGVPAYLVDQSSLAFVEALEQRTERPDLVVFYDGYNEMYGGMASTLAGVAPGDPFVAYGPTGAAGTGEPYAGPPASLEQRYAGVMAMHARARARSRRRRRRRGADRVRLAGERAQRPDPSPERDVLHELGWSDDELAALHTVDQELRSRLPDDVLDVGDVFSDVDRSVYWDTVHTNEVGADLVAQRLVDDLWDRLHDRQGNQ
ncbi:MAG: hypothetical protein R2746_15880 [Acidimicrobiales bacterium]